MEALQLWVWCNFAPAVVRSIVMSISVCLSHMSFHVRLSKTTYPNFTQFSVHVTCGCGLVLLWRQCSMLCTSSFVDDITVIMNFQRMLFTIIVLQWLQSRHWLVDQRSCTVLVMMTWGTDVGWWPAVCSIKARVKSAVYECLVFYGTTL